MILENKYFELYGKRVFEILTIQPPVTKASHMHNEACFLHIVEGQATTLSEIDQITLQARESMLMKCGNYISKVVPTGSNSNFRSFAVHFQREVLEKIYEKELPVFLRTQEKPSLRSFSRVGSRQLVDHFMQGIDLYFHNPSLVREELLVLKLKEIILLLHQGEEEASIREIMASLFSPQTYSIRQIVEAHLYTDISVEELATLSNMSVSTFKREFSKGFADTPASYLKNRKLEKARELLSLSDKRVTDIALEVGFNEISHFSKAFTQKYGFSPSELRMNQMT
jgi:AraC family transcriptional regulator, exoenzyme S synthesis regulatory protein ExsA